MRSDVWPNKIGVSKERKMMLLREVSIVKINLLRGGMNGCSLDILHPVSISISLHLVVVRSGLL